MWALPVRLSGTWCPENHNFSQTTNISTTTHTTVKPRILQTETPCFSYYGLRFLYKITDGKQDAKGRQTWRSDQSLFSILRTRLKIPDAKLRTRLNVTLWYTSHLVQHSPLLHNGINLLATDHHHEFTLCPLILPVYTVRRHACTHTHALPSNHHAVSTDQHVQNTNRDRMI